ncbi:MAG: bifunctional adenosylcobinamide kinase/adenosylcobinamide-phosphate guanylyltransferase [Anaerolineae bacterium]|nr:bifunctional adenosylcobinamide kinase/adenosylcobinamide-phosphate guanylyltransferase [Anaerolineae bacterium]
MSGRLTLILGGARSGKSAYAQQLAEQSGLRVVYVATAQAGDEEMARRIAAHRAARPAVWQTLEAPLHVGNSINAFLRAEERNNSSPAGTGTLVLVDCLTLLASNVILALPDPPAPEDAEAALDAEIDSLLNAYRNSQAEWIIVSNEVGLGLVPPYPLGRAYRDALGRANQRLAAVADRVFFMIAGIPMPIKPPTPS